MSCCDPVLKYVVFLCNFVFFLAGCVVLGFGVYLQVSMKSFYNFLDEEYLNAAIVFISVGSVLLIVCFFGCCGACTENSCMMYTFGILMSLILLVEVGVAIFVMIFEGDTMDVLSSELKEGMNEYGEDESLTQSWDSLQMKLKCCGVESYKDWSNITSPEDVPDSCCVTYNEGCGEGAVGSETIYTEGCWEKLKVFIEDNFAIIGGTAIGIAVFQLLGIIIACCLAKNMVEGKQYV